MEAIAHIFRFSLQVLTLEKRPSEFPNQIKYALLAFICAYLTEIALGFISGYNLYYLMLLTVSLVWVDVFLICKKMEYRLQQSASTFLGISTIGNMLACIMFIFLDPISVMPLMISLLIKVFAMHRLHRFAFRLKNLSITFATITYAFIMLATFFSMATLQDNNYF